MSEEQKQSLDPQQSSSGLPSESSTFLLRDNAVFLDVELTSADGLFQFIGVQAQVLGIVNDAQALESELKKREQALSTGLMDRFAIPHAKCDLVSQPAILFVRTQTPLAWTMLEGQGAQYFFVLLVPTRDAGEVHLKMLSALSVALLEPEFRRAIAQSTTPHELVTYVGNNVIVH